MNNYLNSAIKEFKFYKILGEKTFVQVPGEKLCWKYSAHSNSIGIIVKHLSGNMISRWTNFLTQDGEKKWRNRDAEFENDIISRKNLLEKWNEGWECLFNALSSLTEADLEKEIYIRNQGHTVLEAINRQLTHYSYHIGQIVFIGKIICADNWTSISIPLGKSEIFNNKKFSKPKHKEHYTGKVIGKTKSRAKRF